MKLFYIILPLVWVLVSAALPLTLASQLSGLSLKDESRATGLSIDLLQLRKAYTQHLLAGGNPQNFVPPHDLSDYSNGRIRVEIITDADGSLLLPALQGLGLEEGVAFRKVINGYFPINNLSSLSTVSDLFSVSLAYLPIASTGTARTQGDVAINTDVLRAAYQLNGRGIKVGVLSDSYNALQGEGIGIITGDLPGPGNPNGYTTPVTVLEESTGTDEGRAMLEIIHDIAPEAALFFHTARGGKAAFANAITLLANEADCDVIIDDIIYSSSAYFQDDIAAQAVEEVSEAGAVYLTSAGNQGDFSYESRFILGDEFLLNYLDMVGNLILFPIFRHDFGNGDDLQEVTIAPGAEVRIVLQWEDPHTGISGLPGPLTDLDLFLVSADAEDIIAYSINTNYLGNPVEILSYSNTTGSPQALNIMVGLTAGPLPARFKYIYYGDMAVNEYFEGSSTIFGHANTPGAITVGAINYDDTPNFGNPVPRMANYSSHGGTPIVFDGNGFRRENVIRTKPNVVGPDGVDNTFFGGDSDGNGQPNFFGTSAAVPHLGALAALLLEINPALEPEDVRSIMNESAIDLSSPGFDFKTGHGLIDALQAGNMAAMCTRTLTISGLDSYFPERRIAAKTSIQANLIVQEQMQFSAGERIQLLPGFRVQAGAQFRAAVAQDCESIVFPLPESNAALVARNDQQALKAVTTGQQNPITSLHAFPNPTQDQVFLEYNLATAARVSIRILDGQGKLLRHPVELLSREAGHHREVLDIGTLPPGYYLLVLESGNEQSQLKLIKQ